MTSDADIDPFAGQSPRATSRFWAFLALLLLVPASSIGTTMAMGVEATEGPIGQSIYGAGKLWLIVFPAVWYLFVDRGRPSWSPPRRGGFGIGIALGLVISAIVIVGFYTVGRQMIDPALIRDQAAESGIDVRWKYIGLAIYLSTINSALEEYVWRWFVFRKCEVLFPHQGGWIAVLLSAVLFTIHHVIALRLQFGWMVTIIGSLGVFIGGATWSWCYLRFRSIWPGYISHLIVDIAVLWVGWVLIFG